MYHDNCRQNVFRKIVKFHMRSDKFLSKITIFFYNSLLCFDSYDNKCLPYHCSNYAQLNK